MLYLYTGDGKGKTTAALGAALRATGYGWNVAIIQFMKGTWHTGEIDAVKAIPNIDLIQAGKGFYKILDDKFTDEEHQAAAQEAIELIQEKINSKKYQLIILDEVNVAADLKLLEEKAILDLLNNADASLHFIFTGRNAPQSFIDHADLVTEMTNIKHPFDNGIQALKGLDF